MSPAATATAGSAGTDETLDVRRVESARDVAAIAGTLSRAFFDDPVLRWTFPDPQRRWRNFPGLFELYAQTFARHRETYMTTDAIGAALWLPPGRPLLDEGEEVTFGEAVGERAGADADRLFALWELLDAHHPPGEYYVLQLLAVEPQWQGQGVGSRLIEPVLARCDSEGAPAYLEATSELSAALYERHGFEAIGEIPLPDGPSLIPMWRAPATR